MKKKKLQLYFKPTRRHFIKDAIRASKHPIRLLTHELGKRRKPITGYKAETSTDILALDSCKESPKSILEVESDTDKGFRAPDVP